MNAGLPMLIAIGLTVAGCGKGLAPSRTEYDAKLRQRAAFDLGCPEAELTLVPLADGDLPASQGVTGCGKKATYVFSMGSGAWVKNDDGTAATAPAPTGAPAEKSAPTN